MLLFHHDPVTGVFRGSSTALADPLELQLAQQAVRGPRLLAAEGEMRFAQEAAIDAYNQAVDQAGEDGEALASAAAIRDIAMSDVSAVFAAAQAEAEVAASAVEPTQWLIPAYAVAVPPPEFGFDEEAVFIDGEWVIRSAPDLTPDDQPVDPAAETEALAQAVRMQRNTLISRARWLIDRHKDEQALGLTHTLVQEDYIDVLRYVQDLRDLPEQDGFPHLVEWPALDPALFETGGTNTTPV